MGSGGGRMVRVGFEDSQRAGQGPSAVTSPRDPHVIDRHELHELGRPSHPPKKGKIESFLSYADNPLRSDIQPKSETLANYVDLVARFDADRNLLLGEFFMCT